MIIFTKITENETKKEKVWIAAAAAEGDEGKNVSNTELSERLGITPQAVGQFVNGEVDPSLWRLHTIAEVLDVRVKDLFL